jgi:hypothetical protein
MKCQDCQALIDFDEGGFMWDGLAFCELHDPEEKQEEDLDRCRLGCVCSKDETESV